MRMRTLLGSLSLASLFVASGCVTGPHVIPAGGVPQAVSAANGISLVVSDEEWDGSPGDLNEYVTALPVELTNSGQTEVRVSYFDFALVDDQGFRYKALNPFQTRVGALEPGTPAGEQLAAASLATLRYPEEVDPYGGILLAGRGVRIAPPTPRPHVYGTFGHPRVVPTPRPGYNVYRYPTRTPWFGWHSGFEYGHWRGYRVLPGYRPWFGPGFGYYWADPLFWPPGYASWVLGWGALGYPRYATVPQDVINLALPEGVLQPGGHVAGFLYFQRAKPGVKHMMLTWDMAEARQGTQLGQAQIQLDVVE